MLQKQITLFLLLFFNLFLFAQNEDYGKAISIIKYQIRYGADTLKDDRADWADYVLVYNDTNSTFYNEDTYNFYFLVDKKVREMQKGVVNNLGTMPKVPKHKTSLLKKGNDIYAYMPIGRFMYSYKEPSLKWEVLNEKKKINEFNCVLAKTTTDTGNVFYAWFTDSIPIPEGPFRFKGLPGIILEVYNERKTIKITASKIEKYEGNISFVKYPKVIHLDEKKKKIIKSRNEFIENPSIELAGSNIKIYNANTKEEIKLKPLKKNDIYTSKDLLD